MKIRIKGNSVRYRLSRSDVNQFIVNGYIAEHTQFGQQTFTYALRLFNGQAITAGYENNTITVYMPEAMAEPWQKDDCIGFKSDGTLPFILLEKDFQCLDNVEEDQSDNYPNPLAIKN